ncbi:7-deoxyloganetic acid glucosyltransferase-like isoform X2 [Alnus glutinosa]|uniref:7-deoxyloganetic acid glucosyltransferase-like isoform X2 n=1 Tax=Alnus glutinosa TaxID=3517 RepID=UPI002D78C945|nr:7-deoxyloganetic acid glucosyltransferase-like isoform X2 [Alnus glutinosa]
MDQQQQAHVLLFPFPALGHIKPLLSLAELLCHAGLHVTFLNTDHNHRCLTHLQRLSTHFSTLRFESIPDGLPIDHPRNVQLIGDLMFSVKSVTKPKFRDLLADLSTKSERPVTCVIADGIMSFAIDIAKELGIQAMTFWAFSPCCLWSFLCLPELIEEGQLPVRDDMDRMVKGVSGMESLLRRQDLPNICRRQLDDPIFQFYVEEIKAITQTSVLILNSFDHLEALTLSYITPFFSRIYTIGPLTALLTSRITHDVLQSLSSFNNLWEADRSCMTWLDSQPLRSVVYVSFGSTGIMTRGQLFEFWHGLVNSGMPFLWVVRRDGIGHIAGVEGEHAIPEELHEGTKERGFLVDWAPQEEVLAHQAVGGFLTHSGWNSTLEGIVAGVPMLCWPTIADQQINSRWVSEVWRIGLDMKDTCDRSTIEMMIRAMMKERREEIIMSMDRIAKLAYDSANQGGSSYHNLDKLIKDIIKKI